MRNLKALKIIVLLKEKLKDNDLIKITLECKRPYAEHCYY